MNTKVAEGKLLGRINAKRLPEGRDDAHFAKAKARSEFNTKTGKLLGEALALAKDPER